MSVIKKVMYIFDKRQKVRLFQLFILILLGTVLETIGVTAIVPFISAIMYPNKILNNKYTSYIYNLFRMEDVLQMVIFLAISIIIVYILKNLYLVLMYRAQYKFVYNNQRRLANKLMSCYLSQPYSFHLKHNSAELIHNITQDVDTFFTTVLQGITLVIDCTVCFSLVVLLFLVDKTITISISLILIIFIVAFYKAYRKKIKAYGEERRQYATAITKCIQQAFGGIKEIKVLGRSNFFSHAYDMQYRHIANAKANVASYSMVPKPLIETLCIAGLMGVISIKIARGVDLEYFVPTLSVFALAVIRILPSSSRIATNLSNIMFGWTSIDAIYDDLRSVEELQREQKNREVDNDIEEILFRNQLKISDLYFRYNETDKYVLEDAEIIIPKNSSVAFVGSSGAGKTTLADVILGVLEYERGEVRVDGRIIDVTSRSWQKKIGYIPQSIYVMDDTIRRNVAFALEDEEIDDDKVWRALKDAQLIDFVQSLELGLDTVIGEWGARVSGGQRQRIGIARALYNDPEILILDEATSALDSETEKAVMESIDALNGKKTMIIIAHRLSTIQNCQYVYKIEGGKASLQKRVE